MNLRRTPVLSLCLSLAIVGFTGWWAVAADEEKPTSGAVQEDAKDGAKGDAKEAPKKTPESTAAAEAEGSDKAGAAKSSPAAASSAGGEAGTAASRRYGSYAEVTKDFEPIDGLIKLQKKGNRLLAELSPNQLNRDYIVLITIAKGIGRKPILGGMSWNLGDDWVWQFRKADDKIHIVRRNVRFTAAKNDPQERAVTLAYTDSVLFSLNILARSPSGAYVVDLTSVFMSDLPQISAVLPGFQFSENKSAWADVKGLRDNVELEVAATYASNGNIDFDSIADSRGASINVHYSISQLSQTSYRPRQADDRVGYFVTVVKDWSQKADDDRFVRYVNRWDLQKADEHAALSPPKKPIIFWLEKTIPFVYRKPIMEGITEWNKAFEKLGFANAIEVRQQRDIDEWVPEDINYNTFRWITSNAGFSMGPTRVNPYTGQILDADVLFDADFLQHWKQEYENFTEGGIAAVTGGPLDLQTYQQQVKDGGLRNIGCTLHEGIARELSFGMAMLSTARPSNAADREKLIMQGLKEVTMHEIGHTLGLRHNFKASSLYTIAEMNDINKTRETGLTASVMDYAPANIVPKRMTQGDYFSSTIGPYDMWAIEYGYKPISGGASAETAELKKIASRAAEPALLFGTDEDSRGIDPDPRANDFDLGKDTIEFARIRAELIGDQLQKVLEESVKQGEGYERARQAFGVLLTNHGKSMHVASRNVGGVYVNRAHKGDPGSTAPFVVVEAAKQREALTLLEEQVFGDKPFSISPELYNHLAATRWSHWGIEDNLRQDYPVHEVISRWQNRILTQLLSPLTLERLHDSELMVPAKEDAFTTPELLGRLTRSIFSEVDKVPDGDYTDRQPYISSLRRNLQRNYLQRLCRIAMGGTEAPQDSQTIAYAELSALEGRIKNLLQRQDLKLDNYSRAHLDESASRIHKVLDARLTLTRP